MNFFELFRATLPETVLEVAALIVLAVDLLFLQRLALKARVLIDALLGVAGCVVAGWALFFTAGQQLTFNGEVLLAAHGFVPVAQTGILILTAITLLLCTEESFTRHAGEFVAVVLMAAAGGLIVSSAQDLLVIFVGLELLSLGLYILTAFNKTSGRSAEAALKYYLFGGMSAAFLLFGFSYFYGLAGSTNLAMIQDAIVRQGASPLFYAAWILVVAGLAFKVAIVPFHLWAPDAYEGAPAPAAAFIASVSKVASFSLLLTIASQWLTVQRVFSLPAQQLSAVFHSYDLVWTRLAAVLLLLAALSMIVGNLAALVQSSVRRLLAYSAIAHAGYILLGVATLPHYAAAGETVSSVLWKMHSFNTTSSAVLYYVLTYGLTTIGAFGVVAVVERATGSDKIDAFSGLSRRNPLLASVLLVFFLSLAGIPPLVGFWAKFNLFAAVIGVGSGPVPFALVALALVLSAVSLYYYLQVLKRAFVTPAIDETPIHANPLTTLVLVLIALAVVLAGCFPTILQGWIAAAY